MTSCWFLHNDKYWHAHIRTRTLGLWFSAESNIFLFFLSIHLLSLQGSWRGGRRQFICHDFQRRRLTLPPLPLTAALLATREKQPPHEFGPCSPRGAGGQLSFTIAPMTPEIFLSVINLINILIMTWGWQSNQIARCPVTGPPTLHFGDKFSQVSGAVIQEAGTSYQRWAHSRDNFLCVIIKWWLSDGEQLPFYSRNILTLGFCFFLSLEWAGRLTGSNQMLDKGHVCVEQCRNIQGPTAAARKKHDSFSLGTHWVRGAEVVFSFFVKFFVKFHSISLTEGIKQKIEDIRWQLSRQTRTITFDFRWWIWT